jgi:two-component system, NarL family, invasion response regulator UvrY
MTCPIKVSVVHDHVLIRSGIVKIMDELGYEVLFECANEHELFEELKIYEPDIIFVVVNIQSSDNFEMINTLTFLYPQISVVALSMKDDENAIMQMIAKGIKGYLLKDADLAEVRQVIENIGRKGYHYKEPDFGRLVKYIQRYNQQRNKVKEVLLSDKEIEFLKHMATELTYKQIAQKMFVSPRTVDGFRNALCAKLKIKTRIGLLLYAVQKEIVTVN